MSSTAETFSLSHAAILDGATVASDLSASVGMDFYGIRQGTVTPQGQSAQIDRDDGASFQWQWVSHAEISVISGYVSFDIIQLLTGISPINVGSQTEIEMWVEDALNNDPLPMIVRVPSKDKAGNAKRMDILLYAVQFGPFAFSSHQYKQGADATYNAWAVPSSVNEVGAVFSDGKQHIARLISGNII